MALADCLCIQIQLPDGNSSFTWRDFGVCIGMAQLGASFLPQVSVIGMDYGVYHASTCWSMVCAMLPAAGLPHALPAALPCLQPAACAAFTCAANTGYYNAASSMTSTALPAAGRYTTDQFVNHWRTIRQNFPIGSTSYVGCFGGIASWPGTPTPSGPYGDPTVKALVHSVLSLA